MLPLSNQWVLNNKLPPRFIVCCPLYEYDFCINCHGNKSERDPHPLCLDCTGPCLATSQSCFCRSLISQHFKKYQRVSRKRRTKQAHRQPEMSDTADTPSTIAIICTQTTSAEMQPPDSSHVGMNNVSACTTPDDNDHPDEYTCNGGANEL